MDIDEFLDRELSELGFGSERAEEQPIGFLESAEEQPSSLLGSAQHNLGRGNLEQAGQLYSRLWQKLAQQKLKWSKELYGEMLKMSRQLSTYLSQAYEDAKRKAAYINGLISKARDFLKEGKKDIAFKLYSEMQAAFNSIPNAFFEEKRGIEEQMSNLYREMKKMADKELATKASGLLNEISQLIGKINAAIRANDFASAAANYIKCIELYTQVPDIFLMQKNYIGINLLEIYKSIAIYNEISELQRQLSHQKFNAPQTRQK